ncbi:MAG: MerR family transcriptional regulator [Clostridia bacterium]|nr:MerR family transcriptional regulator [Clostridia bacterium]
MKIKVVCERTGLTDRTIRYYIEEELLSPSFKENYIGRKSFDFTEDDIAKLNDIAVLRSFDFSIEEIRQILKDPSSSPAIIKAVKERVSGELTTSQKKMSLLSSLQQETAYTVCELAKQLSTSQKVTHVEKNIKLKLGCRVRTILKVLAVWMPLVLSVCTFIFSYFVCENPIINRGFFALMLLVLMPSLVCFFASKIKFLQNKILKTALPILCLLCIPLSVLAASESVSECKHNYSDLAVEVQASCVAQGRVVRRCDICRAVTTEALDQLPHSVVIDSAEEPTCTETGLTAGSHCSACGTVFRKQAIIPKLEHVYARSLTEATCGKDGYTTLICHCGDNYRESTIFANEKHSFKKNGDKGYRCSLCGLEVCEYGFVDGESQGANYEVSYYITGTVDTMNEQERMLVIYGIGDMPAPRYTANHPFRDSPYIEEVKTVIICDKVTSIAEGAFEGSKEDEDFFVNPFHSVTSFIVKGNSLIIDSDSKRMSGIECAITYQHG